MVLDEAKHKIVQEDPSKYEVFLGVFNNNKFSWFSISRHSTLDDGYKAFKKYVNKQLQFTDEELKRIWDTGRLDIKLMNGNKSLNWVAIYCREAKRMDEKEAKDLEEETKPDEKVAEKHDSAREILRDQGIIDEFTDEELDELDEMEKQGMLDLDPEDKEVFIDVGEKLLTDGGPLKDEFDEIMYAIIHRESFDELKKFNITGYTKEVNGIKKHLFDIALDFEEFINVPGAPREIDYTRNWREDYDLVVYEYPEYFLVECRERKFEYDPDYELDEDR